MKACKLRASRRDEESEDKDNIKEGSAKRFRELCSGEKLGGSVTRFQGSIMVEMIKEKGRASRRSRAAVVFYHGGICEFFVYPIFQLGYNMKILKINK